MKNTLEIEAENVISAHKNAEKPIKKVIENLFPILFKKDIIERITTFDDVCRELGENPLEYETVSQNPRIIAGFALAKLQLWAECFNKSTGKELDWSDSNQPKWHAWMKFSSGSGWSVGVVGDWYAAADAGARQHFVEKKHCEYCFNNPEFLKTYITYSDHK
jgi:hypothetical protein